MYVQAIVKVSGKYYHRVNGTGYNYKDSLYFRTVIHRTKEGESRVSKKRTYMRKLSI